ncbi:MAG: 50S ribosomal protein L18 [Lentisphaeraceae bacterium]|nr:50S ribosomal protein L18 [Lentisphaeraceae bacterium]
MLKSEKARKRQRRHWHIRKKISGTSEIPRMCVYKSLNHTYVQLIDDESGKTLVSASTVEKSFEGHSSNVEGAAVIGKNIAEKAIAAGIKKVVFDRAGFKFHGRVKSLATAAREAGLQF